MAIPTSRSTFKTYCLQKLGAPVININVADEQVEDRLDDALQTFSEEHYDGAEQSWVSYSLTQTDIDNGYITLPDDIIVVTKVLPTYEYMESGVFSYNYQVALQNLSPFQAMDTTNYFMTVTNIDFTANMINADESFQFQRHSNKLELLASDISEFEVGAVIVMRAYVEYPDTNTNIWNDRWVKRYAVALIKEQWGSNLKKHGEVQLLGGVTVNGQQIYDEARQEIELLETELREKYSESAGFIIG